MAFDLAIEIDITGLLEFSTPCASSGGGGVFLSGMELPDPEIEFSSACVSFGGGEVFTKSLELEQPEIEKATVFVDTPKHKTYTAGNEGLAPYAILWPGGDGVHIFPSVEIVWEWPEPTDIRGTGIGFELTQDSGIEFAETIQIAGRGIGIEFAMEL